MEICALIVIIILFIHFLEKKLFCLQILVIYLKYFVSMIVTIILFSYTCFIVDFPLVPLLTYAQLYALDW
jgi:hypothetical protein